MIEIVKKQFDEFVQEKENEALLDRIHRQGAADAVPPSVENKIKVSESCRSVEPRTRGERPEGEKLPRLAPSPRERSGRYCTVALRDALVALHLHGRRCDVLPDLKQGNAQ